MTETDDALEKWRRDRREKKACTIVAWGYRTDDFYMNYVLDCAKGSKVTLEDFETLLSYILAKSAVILTADDPFPDPEGKIKMIANMAKLILIDEGVIREEGD